MIKASVNGGQGVSRRLREIQQQLSDKQRVYVGLPQGSGTSEDGQSLIEIGAIHEFGAKHIPERSFLRVPLRASQKEFASAFKRIMPKVANGDMTMPQALEQIGAKAASVSQEAISAGIEPANAESTVKRKGSSKPLIDTGRLRQAVTWVVRRQGEG